MRNVSLQVAGWGPAGGSAGKAASGPAGNRGSLACGHSAPVSKDAEPTVLSSERLLCLCPSVSFLL